MSTASRQSVLNDRHRALGSDLSQCWNEMSIPQNYATDPYDEVAATRYLGYASTSRASNPGSCSFASTSPMATPPG